MLVKAFSYTKLLNHFKSIITMGEKNLSKNNQIHVIDHQLEKPILKKQLFKVSKIFFFL